jgi:folylpolyglutamate synthase/dihydropteroate synthase
MKKKSKTLQKRRIKTESHCVLEGTNIVLFLDGAHTARATAHCIQWFTAVHKDTNLFHGITELELPSHFRFSTLSNTHSLTSPTTECISLPDTQSKSITVLVFNCNPPREPKNLLTPIWNYTDMISEPFDLVVFTTNYTVIPEKKNVFNSNTRLTSNKEEDLSRQQQMVEIWKSFTTTSNKMTPKAEPQVRITKTLNELISLLLSIRLQQRESIEIHVLITGSLYLVGGLLELLGYQID